jgi:hypothetical protein
MGRATLIASVRRAGKCRGINAIVSGGAGFSPYSAGYLSEMCGADACATTRFGRTVDFKYRAVFQEKDRT